MEVDNHQRRKEEVEECLRGREELREWGKKHNTHTKKNGVEGGSEGEQMARKY